MTNYLKKNEWMIRSVVVLKETGFVSRKTFRNS